MSQPTCQPAFANVYDELQQFLNARASENHEHQTLPRYLVLQALQRQQNDTNEHLDNYEAYIKGALDTTQSPVAVSQPLLFPDNNTAPSGFGDVWDTFYVDRTTELDDILGTKLRLRNPRVAGSSLLVIETLPLIRSLPQAVRRILRFSRKLAWLTRGWSDLPACIAWPIFAWSVPTASFLLPQSSILLLCMPYARHILAISGMILPVARLFHQRLHGRNVALVTAIDEANSDLGDDEQPPPPYPSPPLEDVVVMRSAPRLSTRQLPRGGIRGIERRGHSEFVAKERAATMPAL
jgi:hypothetical protein